MQNETEPMELDTDFEDEVHKEESDTEYFLLAAVGQ